MEIGLKATQRLFIVRSDSARWSRSCKSVEFIYLSDRCSCVRNFNWISKGKNIYTSGRNDSTSDPVFVQYLEWMNSPASNNQILLFIIFFSVQFNVLGLKLVDVNRANLMVFNWPRSSSSAIESNRRGKSTLMPLNWCYKKEGKNH